MLQLSVSSAEPGQYGYCGELSTNKTAEQTLNFTTNWGFCLDSAACARRTNGFSQRGRLQEIYLDILSVKQCREFTTNINPVRELCAAKKISPHIRVYQAQDKPGRESRRRHLARLISSVNRLGSSAMKPIVHKYFVTKE